MASLNTQIEVLPNIRELQGCTSRRSGSPGRVKAGHVAPESRAARAMGGSHTQTVRNVDEPVWSGYPGKGII